jgi:hypothetical protein
MEGGNFDTGGVPQLRLDGIKHGVSEFVADNIRAFAGVDSRAAHGAVEEVQTIAVVVGVEINAFVGHRYQAIPVVWLPCGPSRHAPAPVASTAGEGIGQSPVTEVGGADLINARRRPRASEPDR